MVLLFKPYHVPLILADPPKKTQTRRKWARPRVKVGNVYQARTKLFGPPFARLRVLRLWQEHIKDISEADSQAEGYKSRREFLAKWQESFWTYDDIPWAVEFELAKEEP